ncbi:hypothetical protein Taro_016598 [Colocasia esculenta]|uniref:Large ribosomal subunit protein bL12 C-terminal domain-containing protein n=1 Tax=Colocasia esculenta TaxID=4460 RepID=A0A843UTD5_COLES|nr:hypothetical protein [Colocasia esculenta]
MRGGDKRILLPWLPREEVPDLASQNPKSPACLSSIRSIRATATVVCRSSPRARRRPRFFFSAGSFLSDDGKIKKRVSLMRLPVPARAPTTCSLLGLFSPHGSSSRIAPSFAGSSPSSPHYSSGTAAGETQTQKLERIADELLDLNKLERHDYSILFRLKLGLNRWGPAGVAVVATGSGAGSEGAKGAGAAAATVEKSTFDVKLEKFDATTKIKVIKEVRGFTDLGLKEAKDLVEKAPVVVKKQVTKEEAEQIAAKLKEVGATVVLE